MQNLIILYNPYYEKDVIEQHLKVLIENQKVAFGKVRSKLKNIEQKNNIVDSGTLSSLEFHTKLVGINI